jgi:hypothetical protein
MNYINNKKRYLLHILIFFVALGCQNSKNTNVHADPIIPDKDLKELKQKYSPEVLTYFYETIFYSDFSDSTVSHLRKWQTNILISMEGDVSMADDSLVRICVEKINALGLPIKVEITADSTLANMRMFFGNGDFLQTYFKGHNFSGTHGIAQTRQRHGVIKEGKIGIKTSFLDNPVKRESLILEELTQNIGISGDSYSYPTSIFYQGHNQPTEFNELDTKICQLLYDPLIPVNYSVENFKKNFVAEIHHLEYIPKIQALLKEEKVTQSISQKIRETCFYDSAFYKHSSNIPVYMEGDYNFEDAEFLDKCLQAFNKLSDNLRLFRVRDNKPTTEAGIYFSFKSSEDITSKVMHRIKRTQGFTLSPTVISSKIEILYQPNALNIQSVKNTTVLEDLYKALGPLGIKSFEEGWQQNSNEEIKMDEDYAEIINIIYNPHFVSGLRAEEFDAIMKGAYE